ncbi:hypothetical protein [Streptomyces asiaticus]|uniref:hypothetical protein n=1 Tax=Streptomyces asiaticus TaxID=114695 RepID=UPI003D73EA84
MLFSISEPGWYLIAIAATAVFVIGMRAMTFRVPEELRTTLEQLNGRQRRLPFFLAPILALAILATNLLRPEPASAILFLYSTAFGTIPIALFPVRIRLIKDSIARLQNPNAKIKSDRVVTVWLVGFMTVLAIVGVLALMATPYGRST